MIKTDEYSLFIPTGQLAVCATDEIDREVDTCNCCGAIWKRTNYWQGELYVKIGQWYVLGFKVREYVKEVKYICGACKELIADNDKTVTEQENG